MRVSKTVEVDSAHRHLRHGGRCGKLHGHRWRFVVSVEGPVDERGMVVDFGELKDVVMRYDHVTLVNEEDPLADVLEEMDQPVRRLPCDPTAENLARLVHEELAERLGDDYSNPEDSESARTAEGSSEYRVKIEAWETPNNGAVYPSE